MKSGETAGPNTSSPTSSGWESFNEEKNRKKDEYLDRLFGDIEDAHEINEATGKERNFTDFDAYHRTWNDREHTRKETSAEYGERLRWMHQFRDEDRLHQEQEKLKKEKQEEFDRQKAEKRERFKEEIRARKEEEQRAREEEERKAREIEEIKKKIQENEDEIAKIDQEPGPLVAINADFTHDRKALVGDLAERSLNQEIANGEGGKLKKFLRGVWKGTWTRKYQLAKISNELLRGDRKISVDDKEYTLDEIMEGRKDSTIARFVLGATEDFGYIHRDIGKNNKKSRTGGEDLTESDERTQEIVRSAVEQFATAKIPESGNLEDLKREFENNLKQLEQQSEKDGKPVNKKLLNNYYEVAVQARERAEHGIGIEKIMQGFKVYDAQVRDEVRSEAHRDTLDRIVDKISDRGFGPAARAGIMAATIAWVLKDSGVRTATRVLAGVGVGIALNATLTGVKERNRITGDRNRMLRDAANGLEYAGATEKEASGNWRGKRRAKYEKAIGGTIYTMAKATDLTKNIEDATQIEDAEKRSEATLKALAEARIRIDFSDEEEKDLIGFSSADKRGDERLKLDMAVIRAEKALSPEDRVKYETIKKQINQEIIEDVDKKDKEFKHERAIMAAKKAARSAAIGVGAYLVSQEIKALFDDNTVGIFEKNSSNPGATNETALNKIFSSNQASASKIDVVSNIRGDDQAQIERLQQAGYTPHQTVPGSSAIRERIENIDPSKSSAALKIKYDAWANNGSSTPNGNELRLLTERGNGSITSALRGTSTYGNGNIIDYDQALGVGKIKGIMTLSDGTRLDIVPTGVNGSGQPIFGSEEGVFQLANGGTINVGDHGYKFFEIGYDNGVQDGIQHFIPMATEVGKGSFSGSVSEVVREVVETPPIYSFTKEITNTFERSLDGFGVPLMTEPAHVGLGEATPRQQETNPGDEGNGEGGGEEAPASETQPTDTINEGGETSGESEPTNIIIDKTGGEAPTNPTPTEAAPSNPEANDFTEIIKNDVENIKDVIGDQGVKFLTEEPSRASFSIGAQGNYARWWNSASDDAKTAIINLMDKIQMSGEANNLKIGNGFRAWFDINRIILDNKANRSAT